jgi:GTP pyrophosphokinase
LSAASPSSSSPESAPAATSPAIVPTAALGEPADVTEATLADGTALRLLLREVRHQLPGADADAVARAFELACTAHEGQMRKSGEPYLVHPVRVAHTIAQLGLDTSSVVAGLLHDSVEDSELTVYDLTEQFGRDVAQIVDGVTKLGKVPYLSRQEQQAESFRKMLLAMSRDIRVLVVKLVDRLDNMRTLEHMAPEKQERISRETMQIYAPLAHRLGIEWVRRELQDLSFRYLESVAHAAVTADIDRMLAEHPGLIERGADMLREVFVDREGPRTGVPPFEIEGEDMAWDPTVPIEIRATLRPPFRVHRRLEASGRGVDQLSDVVTYQVVTPRRDQCYAALGLLHAHFRPAPGRFRDYIALPRPNHYRALHTTLIGRDGERLEVQVRSRGMDEIAERGVIAAWRGGRAAPSAAGPRLAWLRGLMDWQEDVADPSEFIEAVKADLFADEVYVFTPNGDIHTFPKGATPIDFSFAIHTDVGMECSGARVNGQLVPLRYRLRQGDTIEILTNPNHGPREEWLKMCVTSRARARIKQHLRQTERTRLRALGQSLVEQGLGARGLDLAAAEADGSLLGQAAGLGLPKEARSVEGIYEAVGAGQLTVTEVADRLAREQPTPSEESDPNLLTRVLRRVTSRATPTRAPALPGGSDALGSTPAAPIIIHRDRVVARAGGPPMIQLAPCCSPVPGDPLAAFFEPGRGIVAHVQGCPEALDSMAERRVHVGWEPGLRLERPVTVEVRTSNTVGLLAEMSRAFSHEGVNIKQANCRTSADGLRATNTFHATIADLQQLRLLIARLKRIDGVIGVERVFAPGSGMYAQI